MAAQGKRDRTHWLYIAVIIAVVAGVIVGLVAPEFGKGLKPLGDLFVSLIKTTLPEQFAEEADDALSTDEAKLLEAIASKMLMARGERGEDV